MGRDTPAKPLVLNLSPPPLPQDAMERQKMAYMQQAEAERIRQIQDHQQRLFAQQQFEAEEARRKQAEAERLRILQEQEAAAGEQPAGGVALP